MRLPRRQPVGLIARRELRERGRSRVYLLTTLALVIAGLGVVIGPSVWGGGDDDDPVRIALAPAAEDLSEPLQRSGASPDGGPVDVSVLPADEARAAVEDGDADVAVIESGEVVRAVSRESLDPAVGALIVDSAASVRLRAALDAAGLSGAEADAALTPPALEIGAIDDDPLSDADVGVTTLATLALVLALVFSGTVVATAVGEEKATRISEVLLAAVRPGELLAGKVLGVGALTLAQIGAAVVPAVAAAFIVGDLGLPDATAAAVGAGVLWFVLGYALYSVAFGALGALVARQQEVAMAVAPLSYVLWGGYIIAAFGVEQVETGWFRALSFVPFLSPMLMPVRMVTDEAGVAEVALAGAVTLAAAAVIVWLGGRVYRTGLTASGPRLPLREALGRAFGRG